MNPELQTLVERVRRIPSVSDGVVELVRGIGRIFGLGVDLHDDAPHMADAVVENVPQQNPQPAPATRQPIPGTTGVTPALTPGVPTSATPPIASDTSAATVMPSSAPLGAPASDTDA